MKIYLASRSPRRRELLDQINIAYRCVSGDINESVLPNEPALDYVERMALSKAKAGWNDTNRASVIPLLAADTAVVLNEQILGKPADRSEAQSMLNMLSGTTHQVMTSVAVMNGTKLKLSTSVTQVKFANLTDADIDYYIEIGDCFDKAGGYGIQGYAAKFVRSINGSYSGVVGLPLYETSELLSQFE